MRPVSPRLLDSPLRGGDEVLYFRSEAVLGLPVSITSYSRHAVSTIQSPISTADNGRSLIDTDGDRPQEPCPVVIPTSHPHSPSGLQFSSFPYCISYLIYWNIKITINLASNRKLLDFCPIARECPEITRLLPRLI